VIVEGVKNMGDIHGFAFYQIRQTPWDKILRNDEKFVIEYLMAFLLAAVDQGETFH